MSRARELREVLTLVRYLAELPVLATDRADLSSEVLNDARDASGQAFAVEYAHTAGVLVADLPDDAKPRAPGAASRPDGTPHAEPRLAARGWQVRHGVYVRRSAARREREA